jgi:uncharacterized protein
MPVSTKRSPTRQKWSVRLRVRTTHLGKGLFARQRFRKGQRIGEAVGEIIIDAEYDSRQCIELSETHVLEPGPPFRYLNHSCEPNCELFSWKPDGRGDESHRVYVQAIRNIQPGDELTIDYAWQAEAAIPCLCTAENCRGWIVDIGELYRVKRGQGQQQGGRRRKRA